MSYFKSKIKHCAGFTLVEVITTIVIMGLLALFFVNYMGTALDYSWESVELVAGEAQAEGTMEQIIGRYVQEMNSDPDGALATLKTKIDAGDYNTGSVTVTSAYMSFDVNGNEQTAVDNELLKVTIQAPGNDLTTILPKSRWIATDPTVNY